MTEECVLTVLEPIFELINESNFVTEKLMFKYGNEYLFIKKINRIANSYGISSFLESFTTKPVFKRMVRSKYPRFVIFELTKKINLPSTIPKLPQNIMEILANQKGNLLEIKIFSFISSQNSLLEINTLARVKDNTKIVIERNNIIDNLYNGSPIFIKINGILMLIGIFLSKKLKINNSNITCYILNYKTPFSENYINDFNKFDGIIFQNIYLENSSNDVK